MATRQHGVSSQFCAVMRRGYHDLYHHVSSFGQVVECFDIRYICNSSGTRKKKRRRNIFPPMGDRNTRSCRLGRRSARKSWTEKYKGASHKDSEPCHDLLSVTALDSLSARQRHMILSSAFQPREDAKNAFGNCLRANRGVRRLMGPPVRTRARHRVPNMRNDFPRVPEGWV